MSDHDQILTSPRLEDAIAAGCEQSRLLLTRRAMLGVSAGLFSWACLPRHAEAFEHDRRLLIVTMSGGMDGLHVAHTRLEQEMLQGYRAGMLSDDYLTGYRALGSSGFVINRRLKNFADWYDAGHAALVHAIAPPLQTRSHFDCMDNVQNGQPGLRNPTKDGWLNRFLAGLHHSEPSGRALSSSGAPLILQGTAAVQSWRSSSLAGLAGYANNILETYNNSSSELFRLFGRNLQAGIATDSTAMAPQPGAATQPSRPATPGQSQGGMMMQPAPDSVLTTSLRGTARLMRTTLGPRVAVLSIGGLDTHDGQIGLLDASLEQLDIGLAAFKSELGEAMWGRTVVVCVTEFGRTARQNLEGTDHGTGTVALLAGGNVKGGRVIADWPGIAESKLNAGRDLKATSDLRSLFKGILRDHLGLWKSDRFMDNVIFPESRGILPMGGLVRTLPSSRLRLNRQALLS